MRRERALFVLVAAFLAAAIVPGTLRGDVLTQAHLLFTYEPWKSSTPAGAPAPNPVLYDAAFIFYPFLTHTAESLREGRLPIWAAGFYAGHPFLASFQSAIFSPFTWIAAVVPLPRATVGIALAPLVAGALGMFVYLGSLGLNPAARWFGGIVFLLNGFSVVWMEHPLTAVACWLPWLLLALERLVAEGGARRVATVALLVALVVLAGHPETAAKILLFSGAWAAMLVRTRGPRPMAVVAVAFAAGVLLTAVQLLPFVEYLGQSETLERRAAVGTNRLFMPVAVALTGIAPDFFGNPADGAYLITRNRYGWPANYAEQAIYASVPALLLAPLGLLVARDRLRARFLAVSALLAAAATYGAPGLLQLLSALPLARVMVLARFSLIVIVCVTVLAAYAVDACTRAHLTLPGRWRQTLAWTAGIVVLALVAGFVILADRLGAEGLTVTAGAAALKAMLLLAMAGALITLRVRGTLAPQASGVALCALAALDLTSTWSGFHHTIGPSQVYPAIPEVGAIRRDTGLFRVYGWDRTFVPNAARVYGLQDARGWDGMNPHRYTRLLDLGYLRQADDPARHLRNPIVLDLLNVKYVFAPRGVELEAPRWQRVPDTPAPLYVNTRALPRAFLVDRAEVHDVDHILRALHDGTADVSRVALLETALPRDQAPEPANGVIGDVRIVSYADTAVDLEIDAPGRRLLVMSDLFYPGWIARVDGEPAAIHPAYYALRAVPVPAGRHRVRLEYTPGSLRLGAWISGLTLAALVGFAAAGRRPPAHAEGIGAHAP